MNRIKYTHILFSIVILIVLLTGCTTKQTIDFNECTALKESFDIYVEKSNFPLIENNQSLCHGLYVGSDFSELTPKWAVGELLNFTNSKLIFKGIVLNTTIQLDQSNEQVNQYEIGKYYKIDMNNICRYLFMMADSRYPSPIAQTIIKPEEIICK